jgi:adenine C2-methylase RlmN of 23S rRNA A2503 and tRNA A37
MFDECIAANLRANPQSSINFSIDSGTRETWLKVKGVDNFGTVINNLGKYSASGSGPEQIVLKYIIFPGVNDSPEDFRALPEIMGDLGAKRLTISCDLRTGRNKYSCGNERREPIIRAAGNLIAALKTHGITARISENAFFPGEAEEAVSIAGESPGPRD